MRWLIVFSLVLLVSCAESEEARIKRTVEARMRENDQKVRAFSHPEHLAEAKKLSQSQFDFYYAKKHLQAIPKTAGEYDEAQKLLLETEQKESEQSKRIAQTSPVEIKVPTKETVEYKLACLNKGSMIADDDVTVHRFRYLLERLEAKTSNTQQQIADMSVLGQQRLKEKYGKKVSLLQLMEQTNKAIPDSSNHSFKYEEMIAAVMTLLAN